MADPFSVAGSAVGVISLAITTCQGVISFYNSWDTQDQSVSDVKGKIERLRSSLLALEDVLPKISSSSAIATDVEQCVLSCREGTARLQEFLGKCRGNAAPLNFRDRLRDCRQRAVFPFRQSSLDSLKEIVRDLEHNLGTALQVLQLDTSEVQLRQTSDLVNLTKSTAVSVEAASHCISNVENKVDQIIVALSQIQMGVTQNVFRGPNIQLSLTEMERRTQAIESLTSQVLPDLRKKLDQLPVRIREDLTESTTPVKARPSVETHDLTLSGAAVSKHLTCMDKDARRLQSILAQRPRLLRTVCDEMGNLEMDLGRKSMDTGKKNPSLDRGIRKRTKQKSYCSCTTLIRRIATTCSIGRVDFFKTCVESSNHCVTCPLYIRAEATTTLGLKMGFYRRLLANTIRATISITIGAGGCSINPYLEFHAIVPFYSPAFQLLNYGTFQEHFPTTPPPQPKEVGGYFDFALRKLYELFRDGRASPTDTVKNGSTLLHEFCNLVDILDQIGTKVFQSSFTLLKGLIAAGVPLNEADSQGASALDRLVRCYVRQFVAESDHRQTLVELCAVISIAGAESLNYLYVSSVMCFTLSEKVRELEISTTIDGLIDHSMYGALSTAIVHRSESDIERILQNAPQSIYEQNSRRQTPLHLSCSWPKGITILFRHGGMELVVQGDSEGTLPLAYAHASKCSEAVQLILEADSALLSLRYAQNSGDFLGDSYERLWGFSEHETYEIRSHLFNALLDGRRRLMSLAITKLCQEDLEELGVTENRLLEEESLNVYKALERRNFVISPAVRIPFHQTRVFYYQRLTPANGKSVYQCGFLNIDDIDSLGFTPLMMVPSATWSTIKSTLQRALWLTTKGANPERKTEQSLYLPRGPNTTAAHYLCFWTGIAVYWDDEGGFKPPMENTWLSRILEGPAEDYLLLLGKLFASKLYDSCICACSSHGCTPAITLLHSMSVEFRKYAPSQFKSDLLLPIDTRLWMIEWFSPLLGGSHEAWQSLSQDIIRYETFEKLELTHTCCETVPRRGLINTRYDSTEREEIHDEERLLIEKLETLVAEFTEKYTELGVSLPEFLKGYWKTRMEEIERAEESLDDEEIAKIEELGVVIHS